jgi:GAF domain-containing protein
MSDDLRAAVAAGVMGSEQSNRALLHSIVEVAQAIFASKAASIMLYDERTDELVFEAVSGAGAGALLGKRISSGTGIAGWVLTSRQPLVIEEVQSDERFAEDIARSTGFVPSGIMAVPLMHEERSLGVLEVLDRPQRPGFSLAEMELLGLFANQAAIALDIVQRARRGRDVLEGQGEEKLAVVARLATALDAVEGARGQAAQDLLDSLVRLIERRD